MIKVKIGQVWQSKYHRNDDSYDKTVRWIADDFRVWFTYKDEEYLNDDTIEMFTKAHELKSDPDQLNDNQQIVLEWSKEVYRANDIDAFTTILDLLRPTTLEDEQDSAYAALSRLKEADQFEVLAAYAVWGLESEAE